MSVDLIEIDNAFNRLQNLSIDFLCELIKIPSTRGKEGPANRYIHSIMKNYCDNAELMQIPDSFKDDPLYSWPNPDISYANTQNLRMIIQGSKPKDSSSIIFNTHCDVVPPSQDQVDPFSPQVIDNVIFGRGACDAKGQIAVLYLLVRTIRELNLKPKGNIILDIVVEEENGGNGTLLMIRNPIMADAAIVLEPTEMKILPATRGAVWFQLTCFGKAGHSGNSDLTVNALKGAINAIQIIEDYHDRLLLSSRGKNKLFDQFVDPMPVTFGMLNAGDWPATKPSQAVIKGVFGFLPNSNIREVQEGITNALHHSGDKWLSENFKIEFNMLNNDGCEVPENHPLTETMKLARRDLEIEPVVSAFTAACDSWRYNNQLNIPTLVFGAGSLKFAHSNKEQISIGEIKETAKTIICFIDHWCGFD